MAINWARRTDADLMRAIREQGEELELMARRRVELGDRRVAIVKELRARGYGWEALRRVTGMSERSLMRRPAVAS